MATTTKKPYFVAIRPDKARSAKGETRYPIHFCTLGGITFHAKTETFDHERQEYSSQPGQVLQISDEQIARARREAQDRVIQWHKTEGGWRSEMVFKSSSMYEHLPTERDPETNLIVQEEVPLETYLVIKPHVDVDLPPAPPHAADTRETRDPAARELEQNAAGIEQEEAAANPREDAQTKREQRLKKKFGPEAVPSTPGE